MAVPKKYYDPKKDTVVVSARPFLPPDDNFDVQYDLKNITHSYTGDQLILDGRLRDPVPSDFKQTDYSNSVDATLNLVITLRVSTPNVSIVDLAVKTGKKTDKQDVNAPLLETADGPMKGIINIETLPLGPIDFKQTDYSYSVDLAAKTDKKTDKEVAYAVLKAAADGLMKGIINFGTHPRGTSNFKQKAYSNSADAALVLVMGEDLVKVLMLYAID
eukprot:16434495-Heterocapsa_arctica.AAC.1